MLRGVKFLIIKKIKKRGKKRSLKLKLKKLEKRGRFEWRRLEIGGFF